MERYIRERRAKSKPPDKPKLITMGPAERAARFRANLKKNPELWNDYKKKERERKRYERLNRTEEKKQSDREQSRERQRRYKQRLKEKGLQPKQSIKKVQTRSEREKTRAYWKLKQTECRLRKSSQKKRRNKEYDKEYRRDQRTAQSPEMNKAESSESLSSVFTKGALRKAASRVKSKLPKAADKFAESLTYIMEKATPRKKTALKNRGIICSPNKRKENLCREKVIAHFRQQMQEKKSLKRQYLWAMRVMKKYKLSRTTSLIFNVTASDIARCKDPNTERAKRSDCLSSDARKKLDFYYNQPSVSTTLPDKKAVKDQTAKKVLDRPLKDVYDGFQKEYPEVKVSFSTFAAKRPQNIKPSKNQPWYSCLCEVCTNVDLKLRSLNSLATKLEKPDMKIRDRYKAVNITLCDKGDSPFHKLECVNRECADCRTDLLMAHLQPLLEEHGQDIVEYTRWDPFRTVNKHGKTVSKVIMVKHRKGLTDTVIELMNQLERLAKHLFNARWQQSQFSGLIKDIPDKWLVLNLDFAENYACVSQMEIQTAHWYHQQVTIHPVVAYYNCHKCQETVQEDIIYISDDLTHDAHAVHKFISLATKHLKESRGLDIQHEVQYSDGCSSQYKSFTPFCDISYALEDFGFPIERHFYGSRHGKGPCDGAGAVVKSAARRAVMGQDSVINNSLEFYEFTKNKLTKEDRPNTDDHLHFKRTMFHVLKQDIPRNRPERIAQTVKGTHGLHCVKTNSSMNVLTRKLSCFCDACQTGHGQCRNFEYVDNWHEEHLLRIGERRVQRNRAVRRGVQPRGRRFGVRGGDAGGLNRRQQQGGRVRGVRTRGGQRGGRGNGGLNQRSPILTVGRMQRGHGRGRLRTRGGRGQTRKDSSSDSSEADNETFEGSENSGSEVSTQDEQPETNSSDDNNDRTERSSDAEYSMILDEPDQVVDAELPDQVVDAELPDQMVDAELLDQVVDAEFPLILDEPDQVVDAEFPLILDEPDQVVDAELPDKMVDAELPDQMVDAELLDQVVDAEFPMILDDPFTFDLTSILALADRSPVPGLSSINEESGPIPNDEEPGPISMDEEPGPIPRNEEPGPIPRDEEPEPILRDEQPDEPSCNDDILGLTLMDEQPGPSSNDEKPFDQTSILALADRSPVPGLSSIDEESGPIPNDEEPGPIPMDEEPGPTPRNEEPGPIPRDEQPEPVLRDEQPEEPSCNDDILGLTLNDEEPGPSSNDEKPSQKLIDEDLGLTDKIRLLMPRLIRCWGYGSITLGSAKDHGY